MKRALIFILLTALIIVMSGCSEKSDSADEYGSYVSSFTPLFNADGTLKTYDDYIEVK